MLIVNPSVTAEESAQALHAGGLTLAGLAIENALRNLYSSPLSSCVNGKKDYQRMICLYLFMYAADSWCPDDCTCTMTEQEYIAIIGKIEELQQECCDYKLEGQYIPGGTEEVSGAIVNTSSPTFILEFNVSAGQAGLTSISHIKFTGVRVEVIRGVLPLPGIVMPGDQYYYTKVLSSTSVTFSHPLVEGEYIKITTIPL